MDREQAMEQVLRESSTKFLKKLVKEMIEKYEEKDKDIMEWQENLPTPELVEEMRNGPLDKDFTEKFAELVNDVTRLISAMQKDRHYLGELLDKVQLVLEDRIGHC
ncbi:uncharacterized protein N7483_009035 [Penicillium malachiteum]|uniref:uncharacterized protein n=1 Tax=Penicillium malachiteum TaxID=1324776 RepID=UPI0025490F37|nr:uncharacterized protein N7483_009035 [Penicillium malachiteum]KAJ5721101.1 hypothetical protein N7483_009035 [Penicillium malachiteum]